MSEFLTLLAVDLKPVVDALPHGAHVDGVVWNPKDSCIEVRWQNDYLETGLSVRVEFPLEDLQRKALPKGVKLHPPAASAKQPAPATEAVKTARAKGHRAKPFQPGRRMA